MLFNQLQVRTNDLWHPQYTLFANGMLICDACHASMPLTQSCLNVDCQAGHYTAIGMVMLLDTGCMQVVIAGASELDATDLMARMKFKIRESFKAFRMHVAFEEHTADAAYALCHGYSQRTAWSWSDRQFGLVDRAKWTEYNATSKEQFVC
jgi:hypothetical protein